MWSSLRGDAGGRNPEAITDGENGFLVPVEDDATAAERLLTLLRDPERRAKIGERGRTSVQTRFSAEVMIQKLIGVYRDLLAERDNSDSFCWSTLLQCFLS